MRRSEGDCVEDMAGIGKVADSKLANKAYDDCASDAVRELGEMASDVMKTLRLFTAPFQLAAAAQDRFQAWLDAARTRVPIDRQIPAPPSIAGPALRAMLFLEEDSPLAEMFVELLGHSIDSETQRYVHPGFVNALEQLSPDEALLLTRVIETLPLCGVQAIHIAGKKFPRIKSLTTFSQDGFRSPDDIFVYFEHLESLGLVRRDTDSTVIPSKEHPELEHYKWYTLTGFGAQFLRVCGQSVPADVDARREQDIGG